MNVEYLLITATIVLAISGCVAEPSMPQGAVGVRDRLSLLQDDPRLTGRAVSAMKEAERAVAAAEQPIGDKNLGQHLVIVADRKVEIARAYAQASFYEDQRRSHNELISGQAGANPTVIFGDLLFASGRAELRADTTSSLGKLVVFLLQHPDRDVLIEGHTDNIGRAAANINLSQRRADTVMFYLQEQGISTDRLSTRGKGEASPVADNKSAFGRQMNRRVEVFLRTTSSAVLNR
ncbi:OmpA family protein [Pseudomonas sp. PDM16]|uniref:OmpA family protein n=1 Tax=Pseudomonas sp. PDM16 TaxID=2769292 RepID=UPI00177B0499|nr:OmpA family protein [Pseudomonas sp. PDM16]MBD9416973.1 OmpA family protein [Pseudomonas sp. PDM16]